MRPLEEPRPLEEAPPRDLLLEMLEYVIENDLDAAPFLLAWCCCVGGGERPIADEPSASLRSAPHGVPKHFYPH